MAALDYASADGLFVVERAYQSGYRGRATESPSEIAGFGRRWHGLLPGHMVVGGADFDLMEFLPVEGGLETFVAPTPGNSSSFVFGVQAPSRFSVTVLAPPATARAAFFRANEVNQGPAEIRLDFPNGDYLLLHRAGAGSATATRRLLVPIEHHLASGYVRFFDYNANETAPYRIRDSFGRQMTLTWQAVTWSVPCYGGGPGAMCLGGSSNAQPVLTNIGLPDGTSLAYTYDAARRGAAGGAVDRLTSMQHLGATGTVLDAKTYLYENSSYPYAITGIVDRNGARLSTYAYDPSGRASSTELAGGVNHYQVEHRRIDESNLLRIVTNPLGLQATYHYNRNYWTDTTYLRPRSLTRVDIAASAHVPAQSRTFGYSNDLIVETIDGLGVTNQTTNDALGRPTSITAAAGQPEVQGATLTWHAVYDLPLTETRGNVRNEYTYDAQMRLTQMRQVDLSTQTVPYSTNGQTRTWTYGWSTGGRLLSINGPRAPNGLSQDDTLTFAYDRAGNLITVTNGLGHVTTYSNYDANGRPGRVTDANGAATDFAYDPLGRLITLTVRDMGSGTAHAVTSFEYDSEGRVVGLTRPATARLAMAYDLAGRLQSITAPSAGTISFTYDAMGNVTRRRVQTSAGVTRTDILRTFDELGRLLTENYGIGRTIGFSYDAQGNVTRSTSPRNANTDAAFDGLARLTAVTRPVGNGVTPGSTTSTASSTYNQNDDQTGFTDANGVATQFITNGFGDLIREVSPDRGTTTYEYDSGGDLVAIIDGRGQRIDYTRDILGRTLTMVPQGLAAQQISYTYDTASIAGSFSVGRLSSVTDSSGSTLFKYDHRGNRTQVQQIIVGSPAFVTAYSYDLADRIMTMTYPSGRIVYYTRDSLGRVNGITSRASPTATNYALAASFTYEPFGPLASTYFANGQTLTQVWQDGRLSAKRYTRTGGVQFWASNYAYDAEDNLITLTDEVTAANSRSFTYDAVNRLTRVELPSGPMRREDYVLDANDNRISVERRALPTNPTAASTDTYTLTAGTNRLASIALPTGSRSLSYDARGNLSAESRPSSIAVSTGYDGYARLTSYTRTQMSGLPPAQAPVPEASLAMVYNGLDQRVMLTRGTGGSAVTRRFIQDADGRILGEYGADGTKLFAEYVWMLPEVGDAGTFGGDDGTGGWTPLMVAVANGTGGAATFHWLATSHLGTPVASNNSAGTATSLTTITLLGFPGQTQTLADLYYNQYRDYDPTTGRYIQADPIGLAGDANPYVYAGANPVGMVDPRGLFAPLVPIIIGIGVGAGVELGIQAVANYMNGRCVFDIDNYNWSDVAISGAIGGVLGGIGGRIGSAILPRSLRNLSNGTKGVIGETLSIVSQTARGSRLIETQARIPGYRTIVDSVWRSLSGRVYYVESKFGFSSLRPAQRAARDGLGSSYVIERWTYDFFENLGNAIGSVIGGSAGAEARGRIED